MRAQIVADVIPIFVALAPKFVTSQQCWSYLCRNFQFQNGTSKIYTIILCGNVSIYGYNY